MTIAVAYKVAANPQDARVEPDGRIDWSRGKLGISDYAPAAIQVAREAADVSGTELVGVSVGTVAATAAKEKKNVLARGLDRVMTLGDDKTSEWSSVQVAGALAALIQRIGGVTLVVTGDASVDEGAQLMPALVGARSDSLLAWKSRTSSLLERVGKLRKTTTVVAVLSARMVLRLLPPLQMRRLRKRRE